MSEEKRIGGRTREEWAMWFDWQDKWAGGTTALIDAAFGVQPFKRSGDPGSCGYRSGGDCASIGVSLHCRLEAGHDGRHAMEVSGPYVLEHLEKAGRG
jgi:hypothetical protein